MGNIFVEADKNYIINRIDELHPNSKPMWGKMSVAQMLAHCIRPIKVMSGTHQPGYSLLGRLFGRSFKNKMMKESWQFTKNMPTVKSFIVKEEPDFYASQQGLKDAIENVFNADKAVISSSPHPIFGKMTTDEWGVLGYKHLDHHLKQFDV